MLRKTGMLIVAGLLGAWSAVGVAGCGEDRGSVKFEGDTGGTATDGTATGGTETAGTETAETGTVETDTGGTTSPTTTEP